MRRWPVFVVLGLLIGITLLFVLVFITASSTPEPTAKPDAAAYAGLVETLLVDADPVRGEPLMATFACNTCHVAAAETHIAPPFDGIAVRAAERRPPLTAAEYIYESITNPSAYIVEGFAASMPQDYRQRLTDQQLGDIIAYLLTLEPEVD
jgi:mono/diheme cytochrome c family protein